MTVMTRVASFLRLLPLASQHAKTSVSQAVPEISTACTSRAQAAMMNVQRRESSSLTTTSETASAVTKSLLLDTLDLVRACPCLHAFDRIAQCSSSRLSCHDDKSISHWTGTNTCAAAVPTL